MTATKHELALKVYNETGNLLVSLYDRWQDEKLYEDFKDYAAEFQKRLATYAGVCFIRATKRPFGVEFRAEGQRYTMTMTSRRSHLRVFEEEV